MTRISFIMPTYNRAHFIVESLRSILGQMGDHDELLVVDDGSTDDTAAVVAGVDRRIRYIRQDNAGKSVALNRALAATDGAYVWICDDDDLLRPGVVELLHQRLDGADLDFVFGRYTRFRDDNGTRIDLGTGYWPDLSAGSLPRHVLEDAFVMQNAALVRRRAYDKVGPFDETMLRSLDYEMFVRLATSVRCDYVDHVIFDQRKHEGARGPAQVLHAAADSAKVWNEYDRRIFDRLQSSLPLAFYQAMFDGDSDVLGQRAALLQRACVSARHDLWGNAITDWKRAVAEFGRAGDLSAVESAICRRTVAGKHGFGGALAPDALAELLVLWRAGGVGRQIVGGLLDGLLWRFRQPEAEHREAARQLIAEIAGPLGIVGVIRSRLTQRLLPGRPSTALVERDVIDADALAANSWNNIV